MSDCLRLTGSELEAAVAERVMGWTFRDREIVERQLGMWEHGRLVADWGKAKDTIEAHFMDASGNRHYIEQLRFSRDRNEAAKVLLEIQRRELIEEFLFLVGCLKGAVSVEEYGTPEHSWEWYYATMEPADVCRSAIWAVEEAEKAEKTAPETPAAH